MRRSHRTLMLLAITLLLSMITPCGAAFTDTGAAIEGAIRGDVSWGDYDNDGDLDLALTGLTASFWTTKVYRCDAGVLVDSGAGLPAAYGSSLDWGDYDNDGDLDLALSGYTGSVPFARIYRNDAGSFTDILAGLAGSMDGDVAWGDYDNDGDLDLLVGIMNGSKLYRNDKGTFVDTGVALLADYYGSAAWGDYDNDGDLDLVMTSMSPGTTKIYRNDAGVFTDIGASLVWVYHSSTCWGDYDNDGDLDLALSGNANVGYACKVYRNDGGTFTDANAGLPTDTPGPMAWGDFDNDGDLDLALVRSSVARIYSNNGGAFTDTGETMLGAANGCLTTGDFDTDGDLDLAVMGFFASGSTSVSKVYRNDSTVANTAPTAPTGLDACLEPDGLALNWNAALDAQTPAAGLSYNVRIGTTPGGNDIFSGMAHSSGLRKVPALGNAQKRLSWKLVGLTTTGAYYCSVQAIDSAFAGSPWATEQEVEITLRTISGRITTHDGANVAGAYVAASDGGQNVMTDANGLYSLVVPDGWSGTVTPSKAGYWFSTPSRTYTSVTADQIDQDFTASTFTDSGVVLTAIIKSNFDWVDYDNDGDLDLAATGSWYSGNSGARIYNNNGGTFTDIGPVITGFAGNVWAWGDYDNDGDLDVVLAGGSGSPSTVLVRNNGGAFGAVSSGLPGLSSPALAWGDYDNDGDLDLALSGSNINGNYITKVYRNTAGVFADSGAVLTGTRSGSLAWGDYDNDGDLDLAFSGTGSKIYRNDNGTFVDIAAGLLSVQNCTLAWGDYDGDGDLDLALSGWYADTTSSRICKIYRNDNGAFTDIAAAITGIYNGKVAWGDIDNDGDLDLAITGAPVNNGRASAIYRNNEGTFQDIGPVIPNVNESYLAWGDYDNDGDLDLAIAGNTSNTTGIFRIYKNDTDVRNSAPTVPTGLSATFGSSGLTMNWAAATDAQTFDPAGLSYNIRVGTSPGACNVFSGMASSAGFRRLPALGNAQKRLSWTIQGLSPANTYYWSVQAIDPAFAGSAWATEQSFTPDVTPPTFNLFSLSPTRVAVGDSMLATVDVTDDRGVTAVAIGNMSLTHGAGNTWTGSVEAPPAPGDYTVTVTAWDAAGNTSIAGADCSTQRVLGLLCRDALRAPTSARTDDYLFKFWGTVSDLSGSSFTLNDGSGAPLTVIAPGLAGLADGDRVSVRGTLETSAAPVLSALPDHVRKQTTSP